MRPLTRAALALLVGAITGFSTLSAQAQELDRSERRALVQACRADIARVCPGIRPGGNALGQCLGANRAALSEPCRTAIASTLRDAGPRDGEPETLPGGVEVHRDVAYGGDPKQRMDIYVPAGATNAPVIFMVHGGGWRNGSKSTPPVVDNKVAYWLPKGYIFISVDYRLLPDADPLMQARDVAQALATAQQKARSLGGDPQRFVLMGHSAGAHLVVLLSADPSMATRVGALPWRGVVALDSAVYDVTDMMNGPHLSLYDKAFGSDPTYWRHASPIDQLRQGAPPMLLVCSSRRAESCNQARGFDRKAGTIGVSAEVLPLDKSHGAINEDLGTPGAYTQTVDRFIRGLTQ